MSRIRHSYHSYQGMNTEIENASKGQDGGRHKLSWLHKGIQMKCYQMNAKWKWLCL